MNTIIIGGAAGNMQVVQNNVAFNMELLSIVYKPETVRARQILHHSRYEEIPSLMLFNGKER